MNVQAAPRYTSPAILLHWLLAVLVLGMVCLGYTAHGLHFSPLKMRLLNWHKWTGVTIFALALARLAWRLRHPPPALPPATSRLARLAAGGLHWTLYALMFVIPISGWLMSSAKGFQTVWFGVLPLPDLIGRDPALGERLLGMHATLNGLLLLLVAGHVLLACKHHFVDRDDVLRRMLPRHRARALGLAGTAFLLLVAARPAPAVEYTAIDTAASRLEFSYTEMGVSLAGSFARYTARLAFDPTKPEAAHVSLDVQMASVDAGADEATAEVAGAAWFDTEHHPLAHFESTGLALLRAGEYELRGNLTIKGRTRAVAVPLSYQVQGARAVLRGEFGFNRSDFGVGEGEWADTSVVADAVRVRFRFALAAGS